jgi:hypothetical protein
LYSVNEGEEDEADAETPGDEVILLIAATTLVNVFPAASETLTGLELPPPLIVSPTDMIKAPHFVWKTTTWASWQNQIASRFW